jgi:hypothetical protein
MAEVIYTMPNMARNTQGEREERIVEIYATSESLGDQHQDYVGTEESSNTLGTVRSQQPDPVSPPRCQIRGLWWCFWSCCLLPCWLDCFGL